MSSINRGYYLNSILTRFIHTHRSPIQSANAWVCSQSGTCIIITADTITLVGTWTMVIHFCNTHCRPRWWTKKYCVYRCKTVYSPRPFEHVKRLSLSLWCLISTLVSSSDPASEGRSTTNYTHYFTHITRTTIYDWPLCVVYISDSLVLVASSYSCGSHVKACNVVSVVTLLYNTRSSQQWNTEQ